MSAKKYLRGKLSLYEIALFELKKRCGFSILTPECELIGLFVYEGLWMTLRLFVLFFFYGIPAVKERWKKECISWS